MDIDMTEAPPPVGERLHAEIAVTADTSRMITRAVGEMELARELFPVAIVNGEQADLAGQHLGGLRQRYGVLEAMKDELTSPARRIIETALNWFGPGLKANKAADGYVAGLLSQWTVAEKQRVEQVRRQLEQAAREKRLEQERQASAERARLEEEARQKAQAALRAAQEAERSKTAAAAAIAAQARADAEAAAVEGEVAAQAQLELASAPLAIAEVQEPAKIAGVSMRDHWVEELNGPDIAVLQAIVLGAVAIVTDAAGKPALHIRRPELLAYLKLDLVAIRQSVRALKSACNIPGVTARNKPTAARG